MSTDRSLHGRKAGERGQSTVEYALVLFAFLAVALGLGSMWHAARDGALLRRATGSSSHALTAEGALGSTQDLLIY